MKDCPQCNRPVDGLFCRYCGSKDATPTGEVSEWAQQMASVRERIADHPLTPFDLTAQQWYNVCKHWPSVAQRCHRPRLTVGPAHPLDGKSSAGPLLTGRGPLLQLVPKNSYEREPGEEG